MNPSVNRLGDEFMKPPPQAVDKTRTLVAQIMLRKFNVRFECNDDGNIQFRLPLGNSAMSAGDLANARLMRTRWFADMVGGFLVHTNLEQLDEVVRRNDFPDLAGRQLHTGFGLWINPRYLQFQFHCQLLNGIFNESLRWELRGVQT